MTVVCWVGCCILLLCCALALELNSLDLEREASTAIATSSATNGDDGLTVINTVDGFIHGVDAASRVKWKIDTGGPLAASHHCFEDRPYWLIPETTGNILVHSKEGMARSSVNTKMLVEKAPFMSEQDGLYFTGQKQSRVLGIDVRDGRIYHDTEVPVSQRGAQNARSMDRKYLMWLGRVDYVLRAFDVETGKESFNLSYSEINALPSMRAALASASEGKSSTLVNREMKSAGQPSHPVGHVVQGLSQGLLRLPRVHSTSPLPLLSTPEGDFYHADSLGQNYKRLALGSTAVSAFSRSPQPAGPSTWVHTSVHPIRIPSKLDPSGREISDKPSFFLEGNGESAILPPSRHEDRPEVHQMFLVKSSSDGGLFALQMQELPSDWFGIGVGLESAQGVVEVNSAQNQAVLALPSTDDHQNIQANELDENGDDDGYYGDVETDSYAESYSNLQTQEFLDNLVHNKFSIGPESTRRNNLLRRQYNLVIQRGINLRRKVLRFTARNVNPRDSYFRHGQAGYPGSYDDGNHETVTSPLEKLCKLAGPDGLGVLPQCRTYLGELPLTPSRSQMHPKYEFLIANQLPTAEQPNQEDAGVPYFLKWKQYSGVNEVEFSSANRSMSDIDSYSDKIRALEWAIIRLVLLISGLGIILYIFKKYFFAAGVDITPVTGQLRATPPVDNNTTLGQSSITTSGDEKGCISHSNVVLGRGSHGTVVFRGTLNGRPVAVKRMLSHFTKLADREISLLVKSDGHPNVVRYFLREERGDFVYLALQLCEMSLREFVMRVQQHQHSLGPAFPESNVDVVITDTVRKALRQIALGVCHLHDQSIVHRDLKPHNILCAYPDAIKRGTKCCTLVDEVQSLEQLACFELKISDMGLSKQLTSEEDSFPTFSMSLPSLTGPGSQDTPNDVIKVDTVGTIGWQAPELIQWRDSHRSGEGLKARRTQNVDIFSLGCVFHFILVPGIHPFGKWFEREGNIVNGAVDLSALQPFPEAHHLVECMLRSDPSTRPTAQQVVHHPLLWNTPRRLDFLLELSDRLEQETVDSTVLLALESGAQVVVGRSWDRKLDFGLVEDVGKYRKYDTTSVRDLLRLIRNKRHHYHELSESLKVTIGSLPVGFMQYFESKFPSLLLHCVRVASIHLHEDALLNNYCEFIRSLFVSDCTDSISSGFDEQSMDTTLAVVASDSRSEYSCSLAGSALEIPEADGLLIWNKSPLALSYNCRGWWREAHTWNSGASKKRAAHLDTAATDPRYRSRLCTHWEGSNGSFCPMRKKGKCDFAHGVLELRQSGGRRDRWGKQLITSQSMKSSGGIDAIGLARGFEKSRSNSGADAKGV